jgi:hypothetical protein
MIKKLIISIVLSSTLFLTNAYAGGFAYIPTWSIVSGEYMYLYFSNIGNQEIRVKIHFEDSYGSTFSIPNLYCYPSYLCSGYSGNDLTFDLQSHSSGLIKFYDSTFNFGYGLITYNVLDGNGNIVADTNKRMVANGNKRINGNRFAITINGGSPF